MKINEKEAGDFFYKSTAVTHIIGITNFKPNISDFAKCVFYTHNP